MLFILISPTANTSELRKKIVWRAPNKKLGLSQMEFLSEKRDLLSSFVSALDKSGSEWELLVDSRSEDEITERAHTFFARSVASEELPALFACGSEAEIFVIEAAILCAKRAAENRTQQEDQLPNLETVRVLYELRKSASNEIPGPSQLELFRMACGVVSQTLESIPKKTESEPLATISLAAFGLLCHIESSSSRFSSSVGSETLEIITLTHFKVAERVFLTRDTPIPKLILASLSRAMNLATRTETSYRGFLALSKTLAETKLSESIMASKEDSSVALLTRALFLSGTEFGETGLLSGAARNKALSSLLQRFLDLASDMPVQFFASISGQKEMMGGDISFFLGDVIFRIFLICQRHEARTGVKDAPTITPGLFTLEMSDSTSSKEPSSTLKKQMLECT